MPLAALIARIMLEGLLYILLVCKLFDKRDKVKFSVVRVHECERVLMCFLFKVVTKLSLHSFHDTSIAVVLMQPP